MNVLVTTVFFQTNWQNIGQNFFRKQMCCSILFSGLQKNLWEKCPIDSDFHWCWKSRSCKQTIFKLSSWSQSINLHLWRLFVWVSSKLRSLCQKLRLKNNQNKLVNLNYLDKQTQLSPQLQEDFSHYNTVRNIGLSPNFSTEDSLTLSFSKAWQPQTSKMCW